MSDVAITDLIGKTLTAVEKRDNTLIVFTGSGESWEMYHDQECCESVMIDDIIGDLNDLVGSPIVRAEENSSRDWPEGVAKSEHSEDSFTWTFYRIGTAKGTVVIRWYGQSNGYYSESVSVERRVQP